MEFCVTFWTEIPIVKKSFLSLKYAEWNVRFGVVSVGTKKKE